MTITDKKLNELKSCIRSGMSNGLLSRVVEVPDYVVYAVCEYIDRSNSYLLPRLSKLNEHMSTNEIRKIME